jgi:hypothetical protein
MKLLIIATFFAAMLCSCATTSTEPKLSDIQPSPVEPEWVTYTRAPIVATLEDNNFAVSDEFVKKSAQQQNYIKKIQTWKTINSLP